MTTTHHTRTLTSPIGHLRVTAEAGHIVGLTIVPGTRPKGTSATDTPVSRLDREAPPAQPGDDNDAVLAGCETQLREYFAGERREFDVPLRTSGTPFREGVWAALRALPWGTVTSYGALGAEAGRGGAGRAVGGAVGANPIPILIPCHRVLAHNNRITGYSGGDGISTKQWLLDHEQIPYRLDRA